MKFLLIAAMALLCFDVQGQNILRSDQQKQCQTPCDQTQNALLGGLVVGHDENSNRIDSNLLGIQILTESSIGHDIRISAIEKETCCKDLHQDWITVIPVVASSQNLIVTLGAGSIITYKIEAGKTVRLSYSIIVLSISKGLADLQIELPSCLLPSMDFGEPAWAVFGGIYKPTVSEVSFNSCIFKITRMEAFKFSQTNTSFLIKGELFYELS